MKPEDKPFWRPVAALMLRIGFPFARWPFSPQAEFRPCQIVSGPPAANDEHHDPSPEAA